MESIHTFPESQAAYAVIADHAHDEYGLVFKFMPKDDNGNICEVVLHKNCSAQS